MPEKNPYDWLNHTIADQNNLVIPKQVKHEKHDIPINTEAFRLQIKIIESCSE